MLPREECTHDRLQFGSGDFYIFCHSCGAWWGHIAPNGDKLDSSGANRGAGSQLSGQERVRKAVTAV